MPRDALKSLQSLMAERKALAEKEGRFLEALKALEPTGFVVAPVALVDGRPPVTRLRRPARRSFKCPKCSRRFARAMHLGRHIAASHKRKVARKRASRGKVHKQAR